MPSLIPERVNASLPKPDLLAEHLAGGIYWRCSLEPAENIPTMTDIEMQSTLSETNYILKRWRFAASAGGFMWVQPIGPKLAPEELAGFIALLKRGCLDGFPQSILFDFNDIEIVGAQWTVVESLLVDLAHTMGARYRVTSNHKRPASAILLYRNASDPVPMKSPAVPAA